MYDYLDTPNFHRYMEMKKGADFATKLASSFPDPYAGAPYPDPSDWIGPRTFVEHGTHYSQLHKLLGPHRLQQ